VLEGRLGSIEVGKEGLGVWNDWGSAKCEAAKSRRGRGSSELTEEEERRGSGKNKIGIGFLIQ